jgi:hypothetical protein
MPEEAKTEPCPFCGQPVSVTAIKCRHCGEYLDEDDEDEDHGRRATGEGDEGVKWLLPVGRSGWAIAAGYLGLLSCTPLIGLIFGIAAIVTGILALREINQNRDLGGTGRAIFGLVMGSLATVGYAVVLVMMVAAAASGKW